MRTIHYIDTVLRTISLVAVSIAGALLVVLAIAMASDIAGRAVLGRSISGLTEVVELAMIPLIFLAFGWNARKDSHIQVDMLPQLVQGRPLNALLTLGRIVTVVALAFLLYVSVNAVIDSFVSGESHYNARYLSYWPFRLALPVGLGLLMLEVILTEVKQRWLSRSGPVAENRHRVGAL